MAFLKLDNPWNPGYAIPSYVENEPRGRGTLTTGYIPRGTIGTMPGLSGVPSYAMPSYVEAEPLGRGVYTSEYIPRRTIEQWMPDSFSGLGAEPKAMPKPGFQGDPIIAYGKRVAHHLMSTITEVPEEFRKLAMKSLLDTIDPVIWTSAAVKAADWKSKGAGPKAALQKAIAGAIAERMAKDIVEAGKTGKVKPLSLLGLGVYEAMGWSIGGAISSAGSAIKSGAKAVGSTVKKGAKYVAKGATKAAEYAKKGLQKLGSLACSIASNKFAGIAAGAAAMAYGAPPQVGAAGVGVIASSCKKESVQPASQDELMNPYPNEAATTGKKPFPVVPVAIGAGALLLILAL